MNARDIFARRIRDALKYANQTSAIDDAKIDADATAETLTEHVNNVVQSYRVPTALRAPVVEYLAERCWSLHDIGHGESAQLESLVIIELNMIASGARAPLIHWPTNVTIEEVADVIARSRDPEARVMAASLRTGQWLYRGDALYPRIELYSKPATDPDEARDGRRELGDDRLAAAIRTIYHPCFAALIAHAEKAVHSMRKGRFIAMDASRTHDRMLGRWAGVKTDAHGVATPVRVSPDERDTGFKILFEDDRLQLSLPLDGVQGDIFDAVKRARGHEGLRHWTAVLHLLSVKGGRTGRFVWTINDHMGAMGYTRETMRDPKTRERITREVAALARLMLTVVDASEQRRVRRPLLLVVDAAEQRRENGWTLEGMTLEIHPALWEGVRKPDGEYGANWFPASPDLPKLHHVKHPHAIILGLRAPIRLRWSMGERKTYFDLTGRKALEFAGIAHEREVHRERPWATFTVNIDALRALPTPGIGEVEWLHGANTLDGVVRFHAAPWQRNMTHHRLTPIEVQAPPSTGAELRARREALGWTQADLARRMGVTPRTIHNAEKAATLPPSVRRAIERGALPSPDAPDGTPRALR